MKLLTQFSKVYKSSHFLAVIGSATPKYRPTHSFKGSNFGQIDKHTSNLPEYMESSSTEVIESLQDDFLVMYNFINEKEEELLVNEVQRKLKKMRYEYDHWDNAIHGYREYEEKNWSNSSESIIERVRSTVFPIGASQMALVHVLDLDKDGHIKAHIDSVKFCGDTIAGLSLLSPCVMQLVNDKNSSLSAKCLLPQRSLYIMKKAARYEFSHEVLKNDLSIFKGDKIEKSRRISIICRSEP